MDKYIETLSNAMVSLGKPSVIDYIQVIVSLISIIISTIAVIMAVKIPRTIANKQDKIALFDKRFAAYEVFLMYEAFAWQIDKLSGTENYKKQFIIVFYTSLNIEFNGIDALTKLKQLSSKLQHASFLFDNIANAELSEMFESICDFIIALEKNVNVEESKKTFINHIEVFREKHHEHILSALKTDVR